MNPLKSKHATNLNHSYAFLAPAVVSIPTEARVKIFLLASRYSCLVRVNSRPGDAMPVSIKFD